MIVTIGTMVIAQSLVTRDEAADALAAEQRQRAVRGETILIGTIAWFANDGEGVYVGSEEGAEQGVYTFKFGVGSAGTTKQMHLASLEPRQWAIRPRGNASGASQDKKHTRLKREHPDDSKCGHPGKRQR